MVTFKKKRIDCIKILIEWDQPSFYFILWNKKGFKSGITLPKIDMEFKKIIYDRLSEESKKSIKES